MSDMPSVSCVIFLFNEENYIEEAITSVLNQSHNITEIIVSDDFSTDRTPEIVKKLADNDKRIKYVLSESKGKFHAYKTGLKNVSSDYFFIMAGDDAVEKDYAVNGLNYLESIENDFFYSSYKICDSNLNVTEVFRGPKEEFTTWDLLYRNWVGGFLFAKASLIVEILKIDDERITFEDWVGSIIFSKSFEKVYFYREPGYLYRRHQNATTIRLNRKKLRARDIKLYTYLLDSPLVSFSSKESRLISERLFFNQLMIGEKSGLSATIKLFLSPSFRNVERVKILLNKLGVKE